MPVGHLKERSKANTSQQKLNDEIISLPVQVDRHRPFLLNLKELIVGLKFSRFNFNRLPFARAAMVIRGIVVESE